MKIDWKRKLTSRKFWAAVTGFVSMLMLALGKDASVVQTVTATVMAGASLIAYIIGEGLADKGTGDTFNSEYYSIPEKFVEVKKDGISDT